MWQSYNITQLYQKEDKIEKRKSANIFHNALLSFAERWKINIMELKVSIVIPIFNQEKNLHISLPAVIEQEWRNIEIIAVNDGSTDSSEQIIDEYAARDRRIIKINKENGGLVDATISGIKKATGDFICFLDPDDIIGPNFISNFMKYINDADVVTMGHFENDGKLIRECRLIENKKYKLADELVYLKNNFLYESGYEGISRRIFISRWNKLYKASVVKKIVPEFEKVKDVSLGEDTIFTFLILQKVSTLIAVEEPNSYIYNTMSSTSMMKNGAVDLHLKKARVAYEALNKIINTYNGREEIAYILYYFLCNSLIDRMRQETNAELSRAYRKLHRDKVFLKGKELVRPIRLYEKIKRICWLIPNQKKYFQISNFLNKKFKQDIKNVIEIRKEPVLIIKDAQVCGVKKALQLSKYRRKRRNAFRDLRKKICMIEKQIEPVMKKWRGISSDYSKCTIEKNIFVFWWDGFENAPTIVKQCLQSIQDVHEDFEIIQIDKNNYDKYTDINDEIVKGFELGKISIQTFSDILRFNLLKNNGGIWIDSTVFFVKKFDIINGLKKNSINTLSFNSSHNFLKYKNCECSWSGYYFASRKNSVFTRTMNEIFEYYYLKYKDYPIYFFIDAALMVCKINKIDNDALSKVEKSWGDMAFLANVLMKEFTVSGEYVAGVVPQKLSWFVDETNSENNSYFNRIICERLVEYNGAN